MNLYLFYIIITLLIDYSDDLFNIENFETIFFQLCLDPNLLFELLHNNIFLQTLLTFVWE